MTTAPVRSKNLNNFSSLPFFNVKWGRQKQLRCVKDSSAGDQDFPTSSSSPIGKHSDRIPSPPDFGGEKSTLECRSNVHEMKATVLSEDGGEAPKPWNLRSRRAVCKEPKMLDNDAGYRKIDYSAGGIGETGGDGDCCRPRAKFSSSLSKQEIEEDFLAILGTRPARRPKKRPRHVQRQIDYISRGFWLSEITADMYKVDECAESGKR